jgi:hypothetical protein
VRELGDRHRDDARLSEAIAEDCAALAGRADALVAVGQAVDLSIRWLRPRRIGVGGVSVEPSYGDGDGQVAADRMLAALAQLDSVLSHGDRPGAILLYDEAHLLANDRARDRFPLSSLLAALAAVQRQSPRVRVILSGLPTLSLNLKRARTYAERMFRHAAVGNLELDAAEEALAIPLAGTGRSFGLSLIGELCEQTGGYPYFLQFFGAFVCSRVGLEHIELRDYQRVEAALLHELDLAFFEDRFLSAAPAEQELMLRMARHAGNQVRASALRATTADLPSLDELLRRLVGRGLVYRPSRGAYQFALPLFASYLRRQAKSQRSQRL